jgi:ribonuclease HII
METDRPTTVEVGIDEAGRGCLMGRVYVGLVILPKEEPPEDSLWWKIRDSKKLSPKKRAEYRKFIQENALEWRVEYADVEEIEKHNILHATILAAHRGLHHLKKRPELILMDGSYFKFYMDPYTDAPVSHVCVAKGDDSYLSIAAASILAKEARDEWVAEVAQDNPQYGWEKNKGYGTKQHRDAILEHGVTSHHRMSFLTKLLGS